MDSNCSDSEAAGKIEDMASGNGAQIFNNVFDVALIFEGGGMRNSATAPVVVELLRNQIFFDWVSGISAGSSHLVNYLSRDQVRATRSFIHLAADPKIGSWRTWRQGKGYFNSDYIYLQEDDPGRIMPYNYDAFDANPARFKIGAFRADDGQNVYFSREDVTCTKDLMLRVQASSTMPMLMPTVHVDGRPYVDGAIGPSGGIPLDAAIADGFERFVVVSTRHRDYLKKPDNTAKMATRLLPEYPAVAEALAERASNYNATKEQLFDLESEGKAYLYFPQGYLTSNSERRIPRLQRAYREGKQQIVREMPGLLDFLGL